MNPSRGVAAETTHSLPERESLRRDYHAQLRLAARDTTRLAGVVALIAFPAWGFFDLVLLPERAAEFITVRLVFVVLIALAYSGLWWSRTANRWPEHLAFALLAFVELPIAWMIPRSVPELEAYLLGFSLAIYGSAFLIVWRWHLTVLLIAFSVAATALFSVTVEPGLTATDLATIGFYLGTASMIAIAAQVYRYRSEWDQFVTQAALDAERRRNEALVAELDRLSREDALTGVGNRRAWEERLDDEFRRARRAKRPLSVLMCDFDDLKAVNDRWGHDAGDAVLRLGASILAKRARATDFVARLGGDEFGIICPDTGADAAAELAGDLAQAAREATWPTGVRTSFSLGVAELEPGDTDARGVLRRADAALYRHKAGRDHASH